MPAKAQPHFSFTALDGTVLGLSESRFDERQRRQRYRLKKGATYWDYAPLLDVVRRRERGFGTHRFTGKSAAEWVADLRERKSPELDRFTQWYEALVGHFLEELAKRPRLPDNLYSIELAKPPLTSSLPSLIRGVGLKRASAEQWAATLRAMISPPPRQHWMSWLRPMANKCAQDSAEFSSLRPFWCRSSRVNVLSGSVARHLSGCHGVPKEIRDVTSGTGNGCHWSP